MKKISTISLFIFAVIVIAILVAGLVFYQNNKQVSVVNSSNNNLTKSDVSTKSVNNVAKSLTLDMVEIKKHNNQNDCWMLINGKVYDITSYFGKHPGGSGVMSLTCGTDATSAYMTQDPYASSLGGRSAHSSRARNLLDDYYLGNLDQIIGQ